MNYEKYKIISFHFFKNIIAIICILLYIIPLSYSQDLKEKSKSIAVNDTSCFYHKKLYLLTEFKLPHKNIPKLITKAKEKSKLYHYVTFSQSFLFISKEQTTVMTSIICEGFNQESIEDWEISVLGFEIFKTDLSFKPVYCDGEVIIFNVFATMYRFLSKRKFGYSHSLIFLISQ